MKEKYSCNAELKSPTTQNTGAKKKKNKTAALLNIASC